MPETTVHGPTDQLGICRCGWESKAGSDGRKRAGLKIHVTRAEQRALTESTSITNLAAPSVSHIAAPSISDIAGHSVRPYEQATIMARLQHFARASLNWLLGLTVIISVIALPVIAWFVTVRVRSLNSGWLFGSISFVFALIAMVLVTHFILTTERAARWSLGRPIFGDEGGGAPIRVYSAALRASDSVALDFAEEDLPVVAAYSDLDELVTKEAFRRTYETKNGTQEREELSDEAWNTLWETEYLPGGRLVLPDKDLCLRDTIAKNNISFNVVLPRLIGGTLIVGSLGVILEAAALVVAVLYLDDRLALLTLVQLTAAAALLSAIGVTLFHHFQREDVELDTQLVDTLPDDLREKLEPEVQALGAASVRPTLIAVGSGYGKTVRNFYFKHAMLSGLWRTAEIAFIGAAVVIFGFVWGLTIESDVLTWFLQLVGIIAATMAGMAVGLYLTFLALGSAKYLAFSLLSAVTLAGLPPALDYIFTGSANWAEASNAVFAILGGLAGSLAAGIVAAQENEIKTS